MKSKIIPSLLIAFLIIPLSIVSADNELFDSESIEQFAEPRYHLALQEWINEGLDSTVSTSVEHAIAPSSFQIDQEDLLSESSSEDYGDRVLNWSDQKSVTVEVEVQEEGLYEIGFDYYPIGDGIVPIEGAIEINGDYPFSESRRVLFPVNWESEQGDFEKDRFGNDIVSEQFPMEEWHYLKVEDSSYLHKDPLKFHLEKGKNEITLTNLRGEMLLGNAYVTSSTEITSYDAYLDTYSDMKQMDVLQTYEAEQPLKKNSSYIRPVATEDPSAVPYDSKEVNLNALGGESWDEPGQTVSWQVDVEEAGFYQITFKVLQDISSGAPVYRTLMINDDIPFTEVEQYQFTKKQKWYNETFSNDDGDPFLFYLKEGENSISLKADTSIYEPVLFTLDEVMQEIEELALSIRMLTGNQQDRLRDWKIDDYLPGIDEQLLDWAHTLAEEVDYLLDLNNGVETTEIVSLQIAVDKLKSLAKKPDEIPKRLTELSEGSNSVAQFLGNISTDLQDQPLLVDRFYVHGDKTPPKAEVGFFAKLMDMIVKFFQSFTSDNFSASEVDDDTIDVWVDRPRQYVELLQNMVDQSFTPKTGIKVKFSIMPDEQKLILANAANTQPDLALGISNWLPYEMSVRGAAVNLRQFDDFAEVGRQFSPGAFLPFIVNDGIYALPETQDFFVQFHRRDILGALNIPVPDTWDDVVNILPELQRYGMNYYTPIAGADAFKPFQATAPFIYQFGGELYESDGIGTTINSDESLKSIQFMTDLNTIYSTPLQVPNFYNHFRYSTLPIGISNFETYVQLTAAAPEISGWWDITPYPGVIQKNGSVARWATGSGQSAMIFEGVDKKEDAWEVLKWWMSADVQTKFATDLQMLYGPEYMWNTANLVSFEQLPWPEEHKEVILEQWEYLKEVPKTPYAYMVERELSNVWNKVVFDGENTRSAVDDSVIDINREMRRKLEEFGYMKNGEVLKPYNIPTIEQVERWLEKDEN